MKKTIEICDACQQEMSAGKNTCEFTIPLLCDGKYIKPGEVDLCEECAKRISKEYYKIAKEHNSTGKQFLIMGECDEL